MGNTAQPQAAWPLVVPLWPGQALLRLLQPRALRRTQVLRRLMLLVQ